MNKILLFIITIIILFIPKLKAQVPELWGLTSAGGDGNSGTIFKTDVNGENHSLSFSFERYDGTNPSYSELCEASNGKLYGVTQNGGVNGVGVLFEYDPSNGSYTEKIHFDVTSKGGKMTGSLIEVSNGKLYGMTEIGGTFNQGVIFEYDPATDIFVKKIDFDNVNKGGSPHGSLLQADNGKLYGMTRLGGTNSKGVLFEYDPSDNSFSKKIEFDGTSKGSMPYGSLVEATNNKLYGMTKLGGTNNIGVLFEYDPSDNSFTKKIDFDNTNNGKYPTGSLFLASNGQLYGMTQLGGTNSKGVLFEYDPSDNSFIKKIEFDGTNMGQNPYGSLIQASDGMLYGMNESGGISSKGVLFEYNPGSGTITKKIDFDGSSMGANPLGSLIQASNGKLYGMTQFGGLINEGVLFEFDLNSDTYSKKIDFMFAYNGYGSWGALLQASNGKFYGLANGGGASNYGVLFEYDQANGIYTIKVDFETDKGRSPVGSLIQASNGMLYGMNQTGGANLGGVLFEYDPVNDVYTNKIDFDNILTGRYSQGSLIQASNDKLYGMTSNGGTDGLGVLFEYDLGSSTFSKKIDFDGSIKGANPLGSLIQASNGKLYGMTSNGGTDDLGVLFEFDPVTGDYIKRLDFDGDNGSSPQGSLMQASNGKLYGMTFYGGTDNKGVLFEYNPSLNTFSKILDFDGTTKGQSPRGSLFQASNGKLFGMTGSGGVNGKGVLFEINPVNNSYTKKFDFSNGSGAYGTLIEVLYDAYTWTGAEDSDWSKATNWYGNSVPTSSDNVTITDVGIAPVIASGVQAESDNLIVNSGVTLTVESGGSLITEGTITNNGTFHVQRSISNGQWHYISSPVADAFSGMFIGDYLQTWSEEDALWYEIIETNVSLVPAKGFGFWSTGSGSDIHTFTGTPNSGSQSIALTTDGTGGLYNKANLIGNPYPSSIDWTGLDDTYGAVNYHNGTAYESYNDGIGTGSPNIPPMQGFFILPASSGTFTVENSDRTHSNATSYYKSKNTISNGVVIAASNGDYEDELWIKFNPQTVSGYDFTYDAIKFFTNVEGISQIYSIKDENQFSIDVRPESEMIPLGFRNDINGYYSIRLDQIHDIASVELEDTKIDKFHDLTKGIYYFDWEITDSEERFILHLMATGIDENEAQDMQVYASNGIVYVSMDKSEDYQQITFYDLTGRVVFEKELSHEKTQSFNLNHISGAMLVQLKGNEKLRTKKIIL
ncbi:choice-of-anchor tandem repeat GloVer-containing protein [Lentimicrobium sp. S6]|uniref:choice-of-anchor tandem repeat GloVer-containing protein n=1 Tax=Lentimicrobium sp. S6 TaxID=2735872 RepID=UPI001551F7FD|nr:choice-of-anchor tandem repeat GloVer-containing protein [Lentimicrobium sp. S6]NPD45586.1 hypothetical protein [Lentimicrobium sp. S6]